MAGRNSVQSKPDPQESKLMLSTALKTDFWDSFPLTETVRNYLNEKVAVAINESGVMANAELLVLGRLRQEDCWRAAWAIHQVLG